ncbi:MAG: MlaD family protein [Phycisphaerales bacterium]|nr:MlaD family protein [Phycisphaerales bacterium]
MNEHGRNFVIGLVTIVALVGLSSLLLQFGELDRLLNPTYTLKLELNSAGTLRPGSRISLNGVQIGSVNSVGLVEDLEHPVVIEASVDRRYPIPVGTSAVVSDALIGNGGRIEMIMPADRTLDGPTLPMDGTAMITGQWQSLGDTIVEQLEGQMVPVMEALDSFNELAAAWTGIGDRVGRMLDPALSEEPGSVVGTVDELNATLKSAAEAMELARTWLGDEQLRADVNAAAWKANKLLESATEATNNVSRLAEEAGGDLNRLTDAVLPVTEEMARTLERLGTVLQSASEGEGTIGQLMSNPDLYRSLEEAARRLDNTLEQLELLLQKIRDEGLQVGT